MLQGLRNISLVLAAILLCGWPAMAQTETAQVTGTVTDPSGAVIPNANVTVRSVGTQAVRVTTTNAAGIYLVTNLLPGTYDITASATGFSTSKRRAIVAVGAKVGLDFHLNIGKAQTVVEVTENAGLVNTETQTLSATITPQQIVELPTLTRNPYDLILTAGNVSGADPAKQYNQVGQGAGVAINGQRASSTNVLLDGSANNDEFQGQVGQAVPLDSVQEFSVLTSNFTAEYGRAGGGIVNVATKSGSDTFHGTAYEFNRVSDLASNSFDNNANGTRKSVFARNQFGYSIGGPIKKNKLFFFNNTEWIRVRSTNSRVVYIPDASFISASNPATQAFFNSFGALRSGITTLHRFSHNDLIAQGFDPCAGAAPNRPCNMLSPTMPMFDQVTYNFPADSGGGSPQNSYELVGRVDYDMTDMTQMYVRYALENDDFLKGSLLDSPYQGFDTGQHNRNQNYLYSVTHTFSPRLAQQDKVVFNRLLLVQPLGARPPVPSLYVLPNQTTSLLGNFVALPGYSEYNPGNAVPFGGPQNFLQYYHDMSFDKGTHQFRFGGSYVYIQDNRTFGAYEEAVEALGQRFGTGMDNFLNGQLYQFQAAINPQGKFPCVDPANPTPACTVNLPVGPPNFSRSNRYQEFAFYGQDSWHMKPRLTLNLGLRWEYYGVQHDKNPRLDSNFYNGGGGSIFEAIRNGSVSIAPLSPIGGLWAKDWHDFAPRVGFAWDIFGDGKTSFRSGYGIGYERNFGNVTFNVIQNPPNYAVLSLFAPTDLPVIPITTSNAGPLAGTSGSQPLLPVSLRNVADNIRTSYAHFWSASLEHEFAHHLFGALEYSGSKGVDLYSLENPNRVGAGNVYLGDACTPGSVPGDPGTCRDRLKLTQYTNINRRANNGFSNYNALNVRVQMRNVGNSGLDLTSNYTWSHAIDNLSSVFSVSANDINLGLLDPFNPRLDRGDAEFDIRQREALSAIWNVPFARSTKGVARQILDGWSFAPIFIAHTGTPYSLFDCSTAYAVCPRAMFNGPVAVSPNGNPAPAGTPNTFKWNDLSIVSINHSYINPIVNISDFGPFPASMSGRDVFRGPGLWNMDLGIYKTFKLSEKFNLQFRGEMYNLFNHSNMYLVGSDNDVSAFTFMAAKRGVLPTGLMEHRDVQLALKVIF